MNSQLMSEFMKCDERTILIVQVRDKKSFAESVMEVHRTPSLSENHMLRSRGLTAAQYPSRAERLGAYMDKIVKEPKDLQKTYGKQRVYIIAVQSLAKEGLALFRSLGLRLKKWDEALGRNSSGSRFLKRKRVV